MKTSLTLSFLMILTLAMVARAEKMDAITDSVVIQKLESILHQIDAKDPSRKDLSLRLADLYSERARLEAMDAVAKNCDNCKEASQDRTRALELYNGVLKNTDKEEKSRVVLQMAQLYELQGQSDKSISLYSEVVAHQDDYTPELIAKAHRGLGENYFRQVKYDLALEQFKKALEIPQALNRAYIQYRMAWCYFHQDKIDLAKKTLIGALEAPGTENDASFHEEGTRDLATFYSRGNLTASEVQKLNTLSPQNTRKDNLTYLAGELDRLGKKSSALLVWNVLGENQKSPHDRIEGHIRMAELQYDVGRKDQCLVEYEAALNEWKENSCESNQDECTVLRQRLRKLLMDWSHSEIDPPSENLLKAYGLYLTIFPDMEMNYRAAVASRKVNQNTKAIAYYRDAADIAAEAVKKNQTGGNSKMFEKDFEAALLGEIEVAEITKDANLRDQAYKHYLAVNPQGDKAFEIKYQEAHLLYEGGKYPEAADSFHALALSSEGKGSSLKDKSADLALDSLVLAHEDDNLIAWANEFAKTFPNRRQDFLKIASHGTLNQVAVVINAPNVTRADLEKTMTKLDGMKLDTATDAEKITYYKDRLILAEKLQNLKEVQNSAQHLLKFKNLSTVDRELALSREEWVAELTLNFASAYSLSQKMKMADLSEPDRQLKLGLLAELAGKNPEKEYRRYIELTKDKNQAAIVASKIIRRSHKPVADLQHYWGVLQANNTLLAKLSLDVYAEKKDIKVAEKVVGTPALRATHEGQTLFRVVFMKKFEPTVEALSRHHLSHGKKLDETLKEHLRLLAKVETLTTQATQTQDWYLQIVTLDTLVKQNRRLATDILALPVPGGLTHSQRREYTNLLAGQAETYQGKARLIGAKLHEIWNQYALSSNMVADYQSYHGATRALLFSQLENIVRLAPREKRHDVIHMIALRPVTPSVNAIETAKATVRQNPFDPQDLEHLKSLEAQVGSDTLVAYLDARISKLQPGVRK